MLITNNFPDTNKNISTVHNFKSGLNSSIIKDLRKANVESIERKVLLNGTKANFNNNKLVAFAIQQVITIFNILQKQTNAKLFKFLIPAIQVYSKTNLLFDFKGYGFCLPETQNILKNSPAFKTGSLFFENETSIENLNNKLDKNFSNNERSSSHYLSPFIHEFLHNVYLNYIYTKYGYEGNCPYTKETYSNESKENKGLSILSKLHYQTFEQFENSIIANNIGYYATKPENQYHEVFAETFTKLICDSLSKDCLPKENPLDKLKKFSPDFLIIIQKLFNL